MKKLILAAIVVVAHTDLFAQTKWNVDNAHSSVKFSVPHLVISEVEGTFKSFNGNMSASNPDFAGAAVDFSAAINSVNTDN